MLVYKYRGGTEEIFQRDLEGLTKNYFWASSIEGLNDPCEAITNKELFKKQYRTLSHILGAKSKEFDKLLNDNADEVLSLNRVMGIYSLSKTFMNELLWAHYANAHRGFCIEYDLEVLLESCGTDSILSLPVIYRGKPPELSFLDIIRGGSKEILKKSGVYKSKLWKYEKEHRIITNSFGKHFYDYRAIKSIYFGLLISEKHQSAIINALEGRGIDFCQITQSKDSYEFDVMKMETYDSKEITYLKQFSGLTKHNEPIMYEIIKTKRHNYAGIGEFEVHLEKPMEKEVLESFSKYLKTQLFDGANTLFLRFYLKSISPKGTPWAYSNFSMGKWKIQIDE